MPENEIITEIHRHRQELAERCGFDIHKLMDYYRQQEATSEAGGRKLISFAPSHAEAGTCVVRENAAKS
jgi:hypothetical protein